MLEVLELYMRLCVDATFARGMAKKAYRAGDRPAQEAWSALWREARDEAEGIKDAHPEYWWKFRDIFHETVSERI